MSGNTDQGDRCSWPTTACGAEDEEPEDRIVKEAPRWKDKALINIASLSQSPCQVSQNLFSYPYLEIFQTIIKEMYLSLSRRFSWTAQLYYHDMCIMGCASGIMG